jgi:hypothetical protein
MKIIKSKKIKSQKMAKEAQQYSLINLLVDTPGLRDLILSPETSPKLANKLYSVWKDKKNQVSKKMFRKPVHMSNYDIDKMEKEGLIRKHKGNHFELLSKGMEIIQTMILGNHKSSFRRDNDVDYSEAYQNVHHASRKRLT